MNWTTKHQPISYRGYRFAPKVISYAVWLYFRFSLSLRHAEEVMQERGVFVDHATIHRWMIKMLPVLAAVFLQRKRPVKGSWRLDET